MRRPLRQRMSTEGGGAHDVVDEARQLLCDTALCAPAGRDIHAGRPDDPAVHAHVLTDVDPIREVHLSEPGLLVVDVAGCDDATVLAFQAAIVRMWGTSPAECTTRDVGQPGVRLRMYADLRQVLPEVSPSEPAPSAT